MGKVKVKVVDKNGKSIYKKTLIRIHLIRVLNF